MTMRQSVEKMLFSLRILLFQEVVNAQVVLECDGMGFWKLLKIW
jgi:hypothetical protein